MSLCVFEWLCLCVSDCKYVGLTSVPVLYSHLSSGLLWRMLVVYLGVRECTWCMWVYHGLFSCVTWAHKDNHTQVLKLSMHRQRSLLTLASVLFFFLSLFFSSFLLFFLSPSLLPSFPSCLPFSFLFLSLCAAIHLPLTFTGASQPWAVVIESLSPSLPANETEEWQTASCSAKHWKVQLKWNVFLPLFYILA